MPDTPLRRPRRSVAAGPRIASTLLVAAALACAGSSTTIVERTLPPEPAAVDLPVPVDPWFESGRAEAVAARARVPGLDRARNVVVFIGDGMGVSTVTAARILEGQLRGEPGEENLLAFEKLPFTALVKTYNTNQQVPDSAGSMTAMMSGVKTKAGVIGVDDSIIPRDPATEEAAVVPTLFERAEARGLATGVVTTTRLTHATPAACYAHSASRDWEDDSLLPKDAGLHGVRDIARQLLEPRHGDGLEVAMGGGRRHFLPAETPDPEYPTVLGTRRDRRDLMMEWEARFPDAAVVWSGEQLAAVDPATTRHLLGLFEPSHMKYETERQYDPGSEPSLAEMASLAVELLSREPKGFVLMVEGGRIDHAHHGGNASRALHETIAFSDAVRAVLERVDLAETLVVVTADHGHVLTIAGYPTRGNDILGLTRGNGPDGRPQTEPALDTLKRPYTTLGYANGPG